MILPDYITKYESKTGEQFNVPEGFQLAFDEKHGFFVFGFGEWKGKQWLEIGATQVDSWKWLYDSVKDTVLQNDLAGVIATTHRNPKAFVKLTGASRYEEYNGLFVVIWEVQNVKYDSYKSS